MKVVRLSAVRTDRLYPTGNIPGIHFYQTLSQTQDHSAAGRIRSMKNFNDTIGNQTRDIPAYGFILYLTFNVILRITAKYVCWKMDILHISQYYSGHI